MNALNIKKILIPVDFSPISLQAFGHGKLMASLFKADIVLVHVIKPHWFEMGFMVPGIERVSLSDWKKEALSRLEVLAAAIKKENGINASVVCLVGNVCKTVLEVADDVKADLIVMGTHGASGFEEKFIGSNAYRIVNESTCPVITIQSDSINRGFANIVLPIDHSEYSRQKVNHAIALADKYFSTVHIVGLLPEEDANERHKLDVKINQVKKALDKHGISHTEKIKLGYNFAHLTLNYAKEINADLIVIMTEWDEGINGIFIGPFARQIVNHSKIPVMSVRPEVHPEQIVTRPY